MKSLYLVDVSSMFFRAFYAIPPLSTKAGLPTNALVGFLNMTVKLLKEEKPDYIVYCLDRKGPSFRNELYSEYKANRSETPEELKPQIPFIRRLAETLGIPTIDKEGYEADDIIGTLTRYGQRENMKVVIVSADKDFAQLIDNHTIMLDTMKNVRVDRNGVFEKWGIQPEQMIDYLAMVGDTSDNIPGIKGVGPKGAVKLLSEYKSLDGVYENIEEISGKSTKQKIIDGKESAYLARRLVTIVDDLDLRVSPKDLELKPFNQQDLDALLAELEFERFSKKLTGRGSGNSGAKTTSSNSASNSVTVEVGSERKEIPEERWSLQDLDEKIEPGSSVWGVLSSRGFCLGAQNCAITIDADREKIGEVLSTKDLQWKGFDLKGVWNSLDMPVVNTPEWDSMLAAYIYRAGNVGDFSQVYKEHLYLDLPELAGPGVLLASQIQLEEILKRRLQEVCGERVFREIELPIVPVLYRMERQGILLDIEELGRQSKDLSADIAELERAIFLESGEEFNVASPKQLGHILFEKMALPKGKKLKTGYSTNSDVLEKLKDEFPICKYVMEYRELSKLKSTYVDSLPKLIDSKTGLVHTHLSQAVTATGRLSSSNPNLQNIPIRTERGRRVRKAFIAARGKQLLSVDYSQIELRVLAHITGDPGLTQAFANDQDIHAATAIEIFGISEAEMTAEARRTAKAVNFGIAYGQGAFGLAETLGIGRAEAADIITRYFEKFPKVREYMVSMVEQAQTNGFVESIFGRRRYIDELKSKNGNIRKFGERAAINAPIQGSASDIVKKAMINVDSGIEVPAVLQVHDELLFQCPAEEIEHQAEKIKAVMEESVTLTVPLRVNVAWGFNWEEAHA